MPDYPRFVGRVLVNNAQEEAAEIERTRELDPLDHDGDGRKGGSRPRKPRAPKGG